MSEQWRPIPGFEGLYDISDHGHVRSLPRIVVSRNGRRMPVGGQLMKNMPHRGGYLYVHLQRIGQKVRVIPVHRLVLAAFVGPCPDGSEACHRDGDPSNNDVSNLYWGTKSQNTYDRIRHGTHNQARKTHCPQDHPYDEQNTSWEGTSRKCIICRRARQRAHDALKAGKNSKTIRRLVVALRDAAEVVEMFDPSGGELSPNDLRREAARLKQEEAVG